MQHCHSNMTQLKAIQTQLKNTMLFKTQLRLSFKHDLIESCSNITKKY